MRFIKLEEPRGEGGNKGRLVQRYGTWEVAALRNLKTVTKLAARSREFSLVPVMGATALNYLLSQCLFSFINGHENRLAMQEWK